MRAPHYPQASLGTRLFIQLRWRLTPYLKMAALLPKEGKVLDLGCGHGLLAFALAMDSPSRQVLGVDHDEARIAAANNAIQSALRNSQETKPNLNFAVGNILKPPQATYRGITLIDVMHYFEPSLQKQILNQAFSMLEAQGVLLVREVDPKGKGLASAFNQLYEKVATTTGFTQAEKEGLHFRTPKGWTELLESVGFEVSSSPCSSVLFADILYVCKKPQTKIGNA